MVAKVMWVKPEDLRSETILAQDHTQPDHPDRRSDRIDHIFQFMEYDKLTDWEEQFVESVEDHYRRNEELTDAQYDKLEEVFQRAAER